MRGTNYFTLRTCFKTSFISPRLPLTTFDLISLPFSSIKNNPAVTGASLFRSSSSLLRVLQLQDKVDGLRVGMGSGSICITQEVCAVSRGQIEYPKTEENAKPRHRFMSSFEQVQFIFGEAAASWLCIAKCNKKFTWITTTVLGTLLHQFFPQRCSTQSEVIWGSITAAKGAKDDHAFYSQDEDNRSRTDKEKEELDRAIALSLAEGYQWQPDNNEDLEKSRQDDFPPSYLTYVPSECHPIEYRICGGCSRDIGYNNYLGCMGTFFHPECFRCRACGYPITEHEFSLSGKDAYHKSCFKDLTHSTCEVCFQYIPTNGTGLIEYRCHPFWSQKYCPAHENDNTARCCSCERLEILRRPKIGGHRLVGLRTQHQKLARICEVTAILVLYGLPRLLTGAILAHELMHGWLRLKGYRNLNR